MAETLSKLNTDKNTENVVLHITEALVLELQPHRRGKLGLDLNSSFERDLGLDSLGRVELYIRLGRALDVEIPDSSLSGVECVGDLVRVIGSINIARKTDGSINISRESGLEPVEDEPFNVTTLTDLLRWHVVKHPDRPHICYLDEDNNETILTYAEVFYAARSICEGLGQLGVASRQPVAIMLPTCTDFFSVFFGILLAGGIPVPIYPPTRLSHIEEHVGRYSQILRNAGVEVLITVEEAKPVARYIKGRVPELRAVVTPNDLALSVKEPIGPVIGTNDIAFIQYTSGSTGDPKGVALTHHNLLSNIRAMGLALKVKSTDVFVSWLPLYHDMGLIGGWLGSLYYAVKFVVMSPMTFLNRPERWLWAIHKYGGTLSAAPNFAYDFCHGKIDNRDIEGLDLSSWRVAANGAEPVIAETIESFCNRFSVYGFKPASLKAVYGLAENSVGLLFPELGSEPRIDRIDRDRFVVFGEAVPEFSGNSALSFVGCGHPIPGHEIRIVDKAGRELPDRREGNLQFRGPSSSLGYFGNPIETEKLFCDGWLRSGDLAYVDRGMVFITGRSKDIIIKSGRNIYAQEIERAVGDINGVRTGCVAVFGVFDPKLGTERLTVMAETRLSRADDVGELRNQIDLAILNILGFSPDTVALVPPHTVLKTSSGKIRRGACRMAFESSGSETTRRAVWLQFLRLHTESICSEARRWAFNAVEKVYAVWWWFVFLLAAIVVWPPISLIPSVGFNRFIMRHVAKIFLICSGIRLAPKSVEGFPNRPAILSVNHTSYLDGLILLALVPSWYCFVAKKELKYSIWTGPFLEHLGTKFVERFDAQTSIDDAKHLDAAIRHGQSLIFFPEGTFQRRPGLLPFRNGAFSCAVNTGAVVVPTVLNGARDILRSGSWFPRIGKVSVNLGEPVLPEGEDWRSVIILKAKVREKMLQINTEPDLVYEIGILETSE